MRYRTDREEKLKIIKERLSAIEKDSETRKIINKNEQDRNVKLVKELLESDSGIGKLFKARRFARCNECKNNVRIVSSPEGDDVLVPVNDSHLFDYLIQYSKVFCEYHSKRLDREHPTKCLQCVIDKKSDKIEFYKARTMQNHKKFHRLRKRIMFLNNKIETLEKAVKALIETIKE